MFAISEADVVTQYPSGAETSEYVVDYQAIKQWGQDQVYVWAGNSRLSTVARTSDGKIYISNIVSNGWDGYLVGTVSGDKITCTLPQTFSYDGDLKELSRLTPKLAEGTNRIQTYVKDTEATTVTLTLEGDRIVLDEGIVLGYTDAEGKWSEYAETDQNFTLFTATPVIVPEDAETFDVKFSYTGLRSTFGDKNIYKMLHGAKKDNDLYIKGFSDDNPDGWAHAVIEGDKATFTGAQYLGMGASGPEYLCPAVDTPEFIPGYNEWEHHYTITESLTMAYDAQTGALTALNSNDTMVVNTSEETYTGGQVYSNPALAPQPEEVSPYPMAPVFDPSFCQWNNGDSPELTFQLIPLNVDGQLLDANKFGFQIFVDGKLYTFDALDFWLDEDMTTVPWAFNSSHIYMSENGVFNVYFEEESKMKELSIKAVYTDGDQTYSSAPTYPDGKVADDILVTDIVLSQTEIETEVGARFKITATVYPDDATDRSLTWSSSDEEVATVSQTGTVNVLKEGVAVIKVTANDGGGAVAECTLKADKTQGIDAVFDSAEEVEVYTPAGLKVGNGLGSDILNSLPRGLYIVKSGSRHVKVRI